jgi:hypothetical protein
MADGVGDYISSSLDPQAGQVLQATLAAQLAGDPGRIPAGLPPAAQALAYINTGFGRQQAVDLMTQLAQQRQAALPNLAAALAAPDTAQWAARNAATADPYALSRVLTGLSPTSVSEARLRAAQTLQAQAEAALRGQQVTVRTGIGDALGAAYGGFPHLAGTGGTPSTSGQRQSQPGDLDVDVGSGQAQPPDLAAGLPRDAAAQRAYIARLQPWQRNLLRQQLLKSGYAPGSGSGAGPGAGPGAR